MGDIDILTSEPNPLLDSGEQTCQIHKTRNLIVKLLKDWSEKK
jgi:hypothetical protein